MSPSVHHPYAAARCPATIYPHADPFSSRISWPSHQAQINRVNMDSSDSEMASDDHTSLAGGAMCFESDEFDTDMTYHQPLDDEGSNILSIDSEPGNHHLVTKYWNLFGKYEQLQAKLKKKEHELQTLKVKINSNPFACVLVDGDGAVFLEQYINNGEEGGKIAGDMLYHGLKNYLQADHELRHLGITNIIVQVYLNVDGLGRALQNAGLISCPSQPDAVRQLTQFGRGFNRAQMLFSFIDVGREKEAADHKIRSVFELMEKNLHCKCLILAGCHDGGYGRLLDTYEYEYRVNAPWHKIRLLETTPTPEKSAYRTAQYLNAFPRLSLPEVFRSEPVVTSAQLGLNQNQGLMVAPRPVLYPQWLSADHYIPQTVHTSGSLHTATAPGTETRSSTTETDMVSSFLSSLEDTVNRDVQLNAADNNDAGSSLLPSYANFLKLSEPTNFTSPFSSAPSSAIVSTPTIIPTTSISAFYSQPNTILPPRSLGHSSIAPTPDPAHTVSTDHLGTTTTFKHITSPFLWLPHAVSNTTNFSPDPGPKSKYFYTPPSNTTNLNPSESHTTNPQAAAHTKALPYERVYYLNASKQRIDAPIRPNPESINRLKTLGQTLSPDGRIIERRFCNKWHIYGSCPSESGDGSSKGQGQGCKYIHGPHLTGDLLIAVRYSARNLKCGKLWDCRDVDCHMGHHCFNPGRCSYPGCKFVDGHGVVVSLDPVSKVYADGTQEHVAGFQ